MIVVVVPAYNEEASVGAVVTQALLFADAVIVVDDGSSDSTSDRAAAAHASVVRHATNRGVGAAISTGLAEAIARGADVVVQVDGDGQHDPSFIPTLLATLGDGCDMAIGTRFELGFDTGVLRRWVLAGFGTVISRALGVRITDPTSGFRAFSRRAAECLGPVFPTKYLSDTVEVLFLAHELGLGIRTVPVRMRQRSGGTPSVGPVSGILYTLRMVAIVASHTVPGTRRSRRRRRRA